jgi:hypothetical protein
LSDYLTGAGHFGVGFVVGFSVFVLTLAVFKKALWVRLYGPFIPFLLGGLAVVPYFFTYQFECNQSFWLHAFFFYPFLHCEPLLVRLFGNIHVVVVVCGLLYVFILWHYIRLVKFVRRRDWHNKEKKKEKRRRCA